MMTTTMMITTVRIYAVFPCCSSKDGFAGLDEYLWKNALLMPVFYDFACLFVI